MWCPAIIFTSRKTKRLAKFAALCTVLFVCLQTYLFMSHPMKEDKEEEDGEVLLIEPHPKAVVEKQAPRRLQAAVDFRKDAKAAKKDWHDHKMINEDLKREGPGEQGKAFMLPTDPETERKADLLYRANGYSGLVSDYLALNRSVKDQRHPACKTRKYLASLPTVSVIMPFHDEHLSVVMRSVWSVFRQSPHELLQQIILVDDSSTKSSLKTELPALLQKDFPDLVLLLKTSKREGLIRARQIGIFIALLSFLSCAKKATGDVIIFLDAHSEACYNWLPPLLEPIAMDKRIVTCPLIDVIDCDTFENKKQDDGARGAFDWNFDYKRIPLKQTPDADPTEPFESPVMAGGYFAINREWFWMLGGYDEGLEIWGGEQYELSFKTWQCGGKILDTPCSRVGHIYRCKHVPFPDPGIGDFVSRNYKRVAEVWMDEFKEGLYMRKPNVRNANAGDLSKQKAIRQKLNCKPFSWFMKTVLYDIEEHYPYIEPQLGASGRITNLGSGRCIDAAHRGKEQPLTLAPCQGGGGEKSFDFTWKKEVKVSRRQMCLDCSIYSPPAPVVLYNCHGQKGNQEWIYYYETTKQLFHRSASLCLDIRTETNEIFLNTCDQNNANQKWEWENLRPDVIKGFKN